MLVNSKNISATTTSTTSLISSTNDGEIQALHISANQLTGGASSGAIDISLYDGKMNLLFNTILGIVNSQSTGFQSICDWSGIKIPYQNGVNVVLVLSGTAPTNGNIIVTALQAGRQ